MRVGIDAHMLGDHSGGNESFYLGILSALKPDECDEYYLFLNPGIDGSSYQDRFHIDHYKSGSSINRYIKELPDLCKKHRIDVLQTQYYIPFVRSCPVVALIHDISYERFGSMFARSELYRNKLLIPYAARKSNKVITVSEFSKQEIVDIYHIKPEKISVIYNAVSEDFRHLESDHNKRKEVREKYGIGDSPYIICVANLQPRKNIPRLIDAYLGLRQENPDDNLKLVLVGKKAWLYEPSVNAAARDDENIILTDYVERENLVALINEAQGFIYPSVYEGFGIPPLEALSCGTRIAVSDIPVMHEVVGDSAIYFDPYDVDDIKRALKKLTRQGTSDNNNEIILSRFSWDKSADKLKGIFKECVGLNYLA